MKRRTIDVSKTLLSVTLFACGCLAAPPLQAAQAERRPLEFPDLAAMRSVSDPQVSPEGDWVAYVVRTADLDQDRIVGDIWMVSWDGTRTLQLTYTDESESTPRFSPDGRYLAFLASRGEGDKVKSQVWILERAGGEARQLTKFPGGVSDYAWSPDGKRLAVIASDPDPDEIAEGEAETTASGKKKARTPKPIVIDRYQFKADRVGYLRHVRDHLYLFDVSTEKSDLLTPGDFDEALPSWSPDGSLIAFSSKREGDPDSKRELGHLPHRRSRRRHPAAAHPVYRRRRRYELGKSRRVQSRWPARRVPPGLLTEIHVLRDAAARRHSRGRGRAPSRHAIARPRDLESRLVSGRQEHLLPSRGRPEPGGCERSRGRRTGRPLRPGAGSGERLQHRRRRSHRRGRNDPEGACRGHGARGKRAPATLGAESRPHVADRARRRRRDSSSRVETGRKSTAC